MIGKKKLTDIRSELQAALSASTDDPIAWLEHRMNSRNRPAVTATERNEIITSLQRFLADTKPAARAKRRPGAKKK